MTDFTVIIPARYASQRLPGKALLDIGGKPMVQHVFERASTSDASRVVVATDSDRIRDVVLAFGGEVCMTAETHPSGTDRLQEAARQLGLSQDDIVVNVQGDEPLIPPAVINQVAANLEAAGVPMATLCEPVTSHVDILDPNIVKVVLDANGRALYFSRAAIPFDRDQAMSVDSIGYRRHLGIYAYRVSLLDEFVRWQPAPLEQVEKLEQLRVLWHGLDIHVADAIESIPPGVDTEHDLARARAVLGIA